MSPPSNITPAAVLLFWQLSESMHLNASLAPATNTSAEATRRPMPIVSGLPAYHSPNDGVTSEDTRPATIIPSLWAPAPIATIPAEASVPPTESSSAVVESFGPWSPGAAGSAWAAVAAQSEAAAVTARTSFDMPGSIAGIGPTFQHIETKGSAGRIQPGRRRT